MYDDNTIIATDKLYIPTHHVDEDRVRKHYVKSFFADRACSRCDHKPERPCDACQGCDAYKGTFKLANRTIKNGIEYYGIPIGDRDNVEQKLRIDFDDFEFVDKRAKFKFDYPVKVLTVEQLANRGIDFAWKDIQEQTIKAMLKKKYGIFVLPPRSGKSLTLIRLGIELGYKMLITADQYDFLNQFIGDIEQFTNLPALQKKTGKKLYGFIKKPSDLKDIQIGIITYQSMINDGLGAKMKKAVNKTFGAVFIDEVHSSCFPKGSHVLLADGNYADISTIVKNPAAYTVRTFNHTTKKEENKPVLGGLPMGKKPLVEIQHEFGVFRCTPDHRVWSHTRQMYVRADSLTPEDDIEIPED